jgi:AcrR family transcriptional regulator
MTSRAQSPARRKPAQQRRAEIVSTAGTIALAEGLESLTLRRVADALGVFPGLVNHYFPSVDDLVAAAFGAAAAAELDEVFGAPEVVFSGDEFAANPLARVRLVLHMLLDPDRDDVSLLWLDAWQASRRRPALRAEVARQMRAWQERLSALIQDGAAAGAFRAQDSAAAALRILAMVDGLSIQAASRSSIDYTTVREMVVATVERELGLPLGTLQGSPQPGPGPDS